MTSRFPSPRVALLFLVTLVGCGRVHVGTQDGGVQDGGGAPVQCGSAVCDQGLVCCNSSCGICALPDQGCIAIACEEGCATNADCGEAEYCLYDGVCPPVCALPEGCPDLPRAGTCAPRGEVCPEIYSPVCGCDGVTYDNRCAAAAGGANVEREGACGSVSCAPQDAQGEGECDAFFGFRWDGERCEVLGGCGCVGSDCDAIYALDQEALCLSDHAACGLCDPMEARGEGLCDAFFGYYWTGSSCTGFSGCSCVGADCGAAYESEAACLAAHVSCVTPVGCGSSAECGEGAYCRFGAGSCGDTGALGVCTPRPEPVGCDPSAPSVCGCDGATYACETAAQVAGTSTRHAGACSGTCAPMDAAGVGDCAAWFGVRWDGASCVGVGGCGCEGADCAGLYDTEEACLAAHSDC